MLGCNPVFYRLRVAARSLKRIIRTLFARAEVIFEWGFGQQLNPLSCLGAFGWYFFWIVTGSGIYLYLFFDIFSVAAARKACIVSMFMRVVRLCYDK